MHRFLRCTQLHRAARIPYSSRAPGSVTLLSTSGLGAFHVGGALTHLTRNFAKRITREPVFGKKRSRTSDNTQNRNLVYQGEMDSVAVAKPERYNKDDLLRELAERLELKEESIQIEEYIKMVNIKIPKGNGGSFGLHAHLTEMGLQTNYKFSVTDAFESLVTERRRADEHEEDDSFDLREISFMQRIIRALLLGLAHLILLYGSYTVSRFLVRIGYTIFKPVLEPYVNQFPSELSVLSYGGTVTMGVMILVYSKLGRSLSKFLHKMDVRGFPFKDRPFLLRESPRMSPLMVVPAVWLGYKLINDIMFGVLTQQDIVDPAKIEDTRLEQLLMCGYGIDLARVSLIVPFMEEYLFRGLLFQRLALQAGVLPAYIVSSITFGAVHYSEEADKVLGATMGGLMLAVVYHLTGSLMATFALHAFNNLPLAATLCLMSPFPFNIRLRTALGGDNPDVLPFEDEADDSIEGVMIGSETVVVSEGRYEAPEERRSRLTKAFLMYDVQKLLNFPSALVSLFMPTNNSEFYDNGEPSARLKQCIDTLWSIHGLTESDGITKEQFWRFFGPDRFMLVRAEAGMGAIDALTNDPDAWRQNRTRQNPLKDPIATAGGWFKFAMGLNGPREERTMRLCREYMTDLSHVYYDYYFSAKSEVPGHISKQQLMDYFVNLSKEQPASVKHQIELCETSMDSLGKRR